MDENEIYAYLSDRLNGSPRSVAKRNGYQVVDGVLMPGAPSTISPWEENGRPFLLDVVDELFPEPEDTSSSQSVNKDSE